MAHGVGTEKDGRMETLLSPRSAGRIVGALYLTGTTLGIASAALIATVTTADDVIASAARHGTSLVGGAFAILGMGVALALIPVFAFPVLGRVSKTMAMSYVLLRGVVEFGAYLPIVAGLLLLANLGEQGGDEALGKALANQDGLSGVVAIGFLAGAAVFYLAMWRGRLVPRWISGWGIVATLPYLVATALTVLGVVSSSSSTAVALYAPLGVQELALAVWLIMRGFATR